ncbi:MAG TPA: thiamine-phosphate kinase [Cytophagales bacterium]|nr:thiamine-phosphate kinase [Cytophagales bacterium]
MEKEKTKTTNISSIGEFGLINQIAAKFRLKNSNSLLGIGDDAAVIDIGNDRVQLISTDILAEHVHFDLTFMPLKHLGYKAVAVNVSDIAAMNALAQQITVSIALSSRFTVEAVDELYEGIKLACEDYNVDLIGGDTTSSASGLIISVTVLGTAEKTQISYRNGAREGDILCVTGDLGGAYLGLKVLQREKEVFMGNPEMQPELSGFEYAIRRQLRPSARMDIIHDLAESKVVPTAMIDISDGLASELLHIAKQSQVGAIISEDNIPIDTNVYNSMVSFNMQPITAALNGGEDYELLLTLSPSDYEKIKKHPDISAIGLIKNKEDGVFLLSKQGNKYPVQAQGWVHF